MKTFNHVTGQQVLCKAKKKKQRTSRLWHQDGGIVKVQERL